MRQAAESNFQWQGLGRQLNFNLMNDNTRGKAHACANAKISTIQLIALHAEACTDYINI